MTDDRAREGHLRRTYGITVEEYDRLLEAQGGVCYICQKPPKKKRLAVDHDHRSGIVRGLLCSNENYRLLGRRDHDPEMFLRAYEYLTEPPAVAVLGERKVPSKKSS